MAHRAGPINKAAGGIRLLQMASKQCEEQQNMPALPLLCALVGTEVETEEQCDQLRACVTSIVNQWRAPPELIVISWHAEGKLQDQASSRAAPGFTFCQDPH